MNVKRIVLRSHEAVLLVIVVVFAVVVNAISGAFLTAENLFDILKSSSIMATMAIGVFVVMLSGGIDLSFPAIATVSMYVSVRVLLLFNGNLPLAFLFAGLLGAAMGCVNAFLIYRFKIPTLIVTLGTTSIFHGAMLTLADIPHIYSVPPYFFEFSQKYIVSWTTRAGSMIGLSALALMTLLIALLTWLLLRFTMLGKGIYAIGGNREAAKRAGFNIMKLQFFIYAFVGLLSGLASIQYVCLVRHVNPFNLMGMQLDVIAAVVLGGASMAGGSGTVVGTLLGVWMIYAIRNSLVLMRIPSYWDPVVIGLIIVASTAINAYRRKRREMEVRVVNA
jgi:simple sugar transport system permease protein